MAKTKRTPVDFSELGGFRYLHFGSEWIQGGMRINRPYSLALEYQQYMLALLFFRPEPRDILQLGLGAGGLAKYTWKYFPDAHTKVIEISEDVYMASRMWFKMPDDDDHLEVVFEDCKKYLAGAANTADWLLVDIYDAEAWGLSMTTFRSIDFAKRPCGTAESLHTTYSAEKTSPRASTTSRKHLTDEFWSCRMWQRATELFLPRRARKKLTSSSFSIRGPRNCRLQDTFRLRKFGKS